MAKGNKFAFYVNSNVVEIYDAMSDGAKRSDYYFKQGDYVYAEDMGDGWYRITGCAAKNNDAIQTPLDAMTQAVSSGQPIDSDYDLTTKYIRRIKIGTFNSVYNLTDVTDTINRTDAGYVANQISYNAKKVDTGLNTMTKVVVDKSQSATNTKTYTFTNIKSVTARNIDAMRITNLRGIFGAPHQFTAITDLRTISKGTTLEEVNNSRLQNEYIGRTYYQHIIKFIPLLIMTPGTPKFMPEASSEARKNMFEQLLSSAFGGNSNSQSTYSGKYYSMEYQYPTYFKYVNAMLRAAAVYLGISNTELNGTTLDKYNWAFGDYDNNISIGNYSKFFTNLGMGKNCICFYADCGQTTNDNFSNDVTQSALANTVNSLSDQAREANFLMGTLSSNAGVDYNNITEKINDLGNSAPKTGILGGIINKAKALLSGGRLVFPEIWSDSHFSRSYTCSMKLVSPSGDKLSIYLNILVPIYHILALTLPRQADVGGQTYVSPFLVRAYYKGSFNVDMGIITGLSISKGAEGEWTVDGLPTVADVQFEIKDLYEGMFMSQGNSVTDEGASLLTNIAELDYIANNCGINVNDTEENRAFKLFNALTFKSAISDYIANDIMAALGKTLNNWMQSIFGKF